MGDGPEVMGDSPLVMGDGPEVLGVGPEVLGDGPEVMGVGPEVLGDGPEVMSEASVGPQVRGVPNVGGDGDPPGLQLLHSLAALAVAATTSLA